ncbi:MAG: hypothetical protein FWG68_10305 [Defluviitaleaceae bacterium]|nr:hypothetical protein [Defluviitaleaceae bacterium]
MEQTNLQPKNLRAAFLSWLQNEIADKVYILAVLDNLQSASDNVLTKKGAPPIWQYMTAADFEPIYNSLLESRLLRFAYNKTYRGFSNAGSLYLRFLQDFQVQQEELTKQAEQAELPQENPPIPPTFAENAKKSEDNESIELFTILSTNFRNGFRLNDTIDLARFRHFAENSTFSIDKIENAELSQKIADCGVEYEGKIYPVPTATIDWILQEQQNYFETGAKIIFFSEFYAKHSERLFENSVISENMLAEILKNRLNKVFFTENYFGYINESTNSAIESELLRIWVNGLTLSQIAEKLPHIPKNRIKDILRKSVNFISTANEIFYHVNQLHLPEEVELANFALKTCQNKGFATFAELNLNDFLEENSEFSPATLYIALYNLCLADDFDKRGKILTPKGKPLNAADIVRNYCKNLETCTLSELSSVWQDLKELDIKAQQPQLLQAVHYVTVRIDRENFIADSLINFDVIATDTAISKLVQGQYLPLRDFTALALLPDCGHSWNLFLLESYCRRFSLDFTCLAPNFNSSNVGVIVRRDCKMDYMEIMADAARLLYGQTNAAVPPTESAVNTFLYESGYIGKKKTSKVAEILQKINLRKK